MKFRYINLWILSLGLLVGCNTAWDKYFSQVGEYEGEAVSPLNLLDYLKTQESYSDFVGLLEKAGVDEVLTKNQVLTVWAIPNENIPIEIRSADSTTLRQFIKNHINNVALYKSKLGARKIHTLAGKILKTEVDENIYTIDQVTITRMNQICQNGVVHELKDGVLTPKQNIYEYMMSLGDECSIFRDTLNAYNDTVFDRVNSLPIGENELGNTVYDSVFVIKNPFLPARGDIRDEERELTLFLPTNDVVKSMLMSVSSFFAQMKMEFTTADTNRIMTWMLKSVIHNGRMSSYPTGRSLTSIHGSEWRTDKEYVKEDFENCSNGNVYIVSTLVFPRKEYMETLEIRPYYALLVDKSKQSELLQGSEGVTFSIQTNTYGLGKDVLIANMPSSDKNAWMQFQAVIRNTKGVIEAKKVMPGTYKLSASYKAWNNRKVALYAVYEDQEGVHEEKVTEFDLTKKANANSGTIGNSPYNNGYFEFIPIEDAGKDEPKGGRNGLILSKFEVKADWGYDYLKFKLVNIGGASVMNPEYFLLEPTDDNY